MAITLMLDSRVVSHAKECAMRRSTYFLGRIAKAGDLDTPRLIAAIRDPVSVGIGKYDYTFTHPSVVEVGSDQVVVARLAKFDREGQTRTVREEDHVEAPADVPNMLVAASPFAYVPRYAGVAYQRVWNKLNRGTFEKAFRELILEKYERFFVDCSIEAIADFKSFARRIAQMDLVLGIEATVQPPNPLFGLLWGNLKEYLARRNAAEMKVREKATNGHGLRSPLPTRLRDHIDRTSDEQGEADPLELVDAAVLMAADGYGHAKVTGSVSERRVIVRTRETQVSFEFESDPDADVLASKAHSLLRRTADESKLGHER
jgi:hypothetical protein